MISEGNKNTDHKVCTYFKY